VLPFQWVRQCLSVLPFQWVRQCLSVLPFQWVRQCLSVLPFQWVLRWLVALGSSTWPLATAARGSRRVRCQMERLRLVSQFCLALRADGTH
jgi:hypothetical protein